MYIGLQEGIGTGKKVFFLEKPKKRVALNLDEIPKLPASPEAKERGNILKQVIL